MKKEKRDDEENPGKKRRQDPMNTAIVKALLEIDIAEIYSPPRITKEATKYEYQNWKVWDNICGVSLVSHHPTGIFPSRGPQMGCHHDHSRNRGLWVVCRYLPPVPPLVGSQLPPPFMHYAEQVLWLQLTTHDVIIGHWSIPGHNYRGKQSS